MEARTTDREIERKYLLGGLPEHVHVAESAEIDQGYLPGEKIGERIRRMTRPDSVEYFRTIKAGSGLVKLEIEEETSKEFFEAVWPLTRGARVHKRRYFVPEGKVTWEIDEFLDRSDFWLAEVELDDAEQRVEIPGWLKAVLVREVTEEKGYTNRALAK